MLVASFIVASTASAGLFGNSSLFLPKFSVRNPGTYEFRVSQEKPTIPHKLRFHTREARGLPSTPFERARFTASILTPDGRVVARKQFDGGLWRIVDSDEYEVTIWTRREAKQVGRLSTYTLRIEVLRPSSRSKDEAQVVLTKS